MTLHRPDLRVWCIDGDGAALMHLGAMVSSVQTSRAIWHIVINNEAHETVGGIDRGW